MATRLFVVVKTHQQNWQSCLALARLSKVHHIIPRAGEVGISIEYTCTRMTAVHTTPQKLRFRNQINMVMVDFDVSSLLFCSSWMDNFSSRLVLLLNGAIVKSGNRVLCCLSTLYTHAHSNTNFGETKNSHSLSVGTVAHENATATNGKILY